MKWIISIVLVFMIEMPLAFAHPVAFKGSTGLMGYQSPSTSHNHLNYSFRYWWALGLHHIKRNDVNDNRHATFASGNFLLKRWYGEAFQANIYTALGAGHSELLEEKDDVAYGMLQFDIEDRKYYFLAKYATLYDGSDSHMKQSTLRAGFAPYVGDFEDLHTWFILEWNETEFLHEKAKQDLTPFLRFFYKNVLFEIGQSFDGQSKFNYILHF